MNGNVLIVRHSYKVSKALKSYTVYELNKPQQNNQFTETIRIEKFRMFSNGSGFDDYLRLRNTNNWKTCKQVTGLFKTGHKNIFYGDRVKNGKRNLLVFHLSNDKTQLIIDYYIGYYPKKDILNLIISDYARNIRNIGDNEKLKMLSLARIAR